MQSFLAVFFCFFCLTQNFFLPMAHSHHLVVVYRVISLAFIIIINTMIKHRDENGGS